MAAIPLCYRPTISAHDIDNYDIKAGHLGNHWGRFSCGLLVAETMMIMIDMMSAILATEPTHESREWFCNKSCSYSHLFSQVLSATIKILWGKVQN